MVGIYQIRNIINNKVYIGSSNDIKERAASHKSMLLNNRHHSKHLQRAFNKWGFENFRFEIIEYCKEVELLDKEQYYLDLKVKAKEYRLGINRDFLRLSYNIKPISLKGFYGKHSKETINKIIENTKRIKKISVFDLDKKFLFECKSSIDCANKLNSSQGAILTSCKEKKFQLTKLPYLVCFSKDKYLISSFNLVFDKGYYDNIICFDIYGKIFKIFDNHLIAAQYFDVLPAHIKQMYKNPILNKIQLRGNTKGYNFIKKSDIKLYKSDLINLKDYWNVMFNKFKSLKGDKIIICDVFNKELGKCNDINQILEFFDVHSTTLYSVLNKKRKQAKGIIIKYNEDIV